MHYFVSNRAAGPQQRGVSHDSAMKFLDLIESGNLRTPDEVTAAFDELHADSITVSASAGRVVSLTDEEAKRIGRKVHERTQRELEEEMDRLPEWFEDRAGTVLLGGDAVAKAVAQPRPVFDTQATYDRINRRAK